MRKLIYVSALAASLLAAGACKSKDERMSDTGKAVEKATERVEDKKEDLADKQEELAKEREKVMEAERDHQEKLREVEKQEGEVAAAQGGDILARDEFARVSREHLSRVDAKLRDLEARGDARSQSALADLRARREALSAKIEAIGASVHEGWAKTKDEITDGFAKLDKDVDDAFKNDTVRDRVTPKDPMPPPARDVAPTR